MCEALGAGAQSLILRKGGIHEGRGGFWWKHERFFLFPTHFHEQSTQFTWGDGAEPPAPEEGSHTIRLFAEVTHKQQLTTWEETARLAPFHFWTEEAIRARFDYTDEAGISLAWLRVYRLEKRWTFPDERKFGGCRSWLDLPAVSEDLAAVSVLSDAEDARRRELAGLPAIAIASKAQ